MPILDQIHRSNMDRLRADHEQAREAERSSSLQSQRSLSMFIADQSPLNAAFLVAANAGLVAARAAVERTEFALTKERILDLLRRQDSLASTGVTDSEYYSPIREQAYRSLGWNDAIYHHALAAANNADFQRLGEQGKVAELLQYFNGQGVTLPVWAWKHLLNEHRGWRMQFGLWSDDLAVTARRWIEEALPVVS